MRAVITAVIFPVLMVVSFGICAPIAFLTELLTGSEEAVHKVARLWAKCVLIPSGIKVYARGVDNIPKDRPVVFACNHASQSDIPVLYQALPVPFRFVVKEELFRIPYLSMAMKAAGYIPVNRSGGKAAMKSLREAAERIKSGASIVIFPEGTRSQDGNLGSFKSGAFLLAIKSACPVVPVAICGTHAILPKGSVHARPGDVYVSIGEPLFMDSDKKNARSEVAQIVHSRIEGLMSDINKER